MRSIALVIALVAVLIASAFAQKAEIEAVNAKWIDFFNAGDFAGVASLYTEDATAFPPGSGMVKGRAAIEALWKAMAEQVSDPKLTTLDVKPLGPSAAREIGTFSLKTKGTNISWCGRRSEATGNSQPIFGTTASRRLDQEYPGLRADKHSSTNPGRLCPSRDATGQQSVTQSEDWYKM